MKAPIVALFTGSLFVAAHHSAPASAEDNWPQFRGPTGQGLCMAKGLPLEWGGAEKRNVRWQVPLPGEGHASPIVWGGKVVTCTVRWPDDAIDRAKVMPTHHVTCYGATDGERLWDTVVPPGPWLRDDFRSGAGGGYAAPTPATDGRLIYCVFGSAVIAAIDFDGRIVWRRDIRPFTFDVTIGSSPALFGDSVILQCTMADRKDSAIIAYDKATGDLRWRTPMPTIGFAHSTPLLIDVDGRPQMLIVASGMGVTGDGLQSFDPVNGRRLWWCRGGGDASSPASGSGVVYFDSGRGGPGFAVDPTGMGDVSQTHVRWQVDQVPEAIGSPLIVGGHLYRLNSPGVLKCFNAETGERRYIERLEGLTSTWASPVADADGRIYFASAGTSVVVQAGPEFKVLAVNELGDANHASAAVAGGRIYLLGLKNLHCVGEK